MRLCHICIVGHRIPTVWQWTCSGEAIVMVRLDAKLDVNSAYLLAASS
ncbi:MAG: hypothetical protein J6M47_00460 [Clostridia bacterium]|nr:hypothetical protein [Clostridia bacterium]